MSKKLSYYKILEFVEYSKKMDVRITDFKYEPINDNLYTVI